MKAGRSGAEEELGRQIEEAEATIRKAAFDLSPYALEELGLCEAIRLLAEEEGRRETIEISMDCEALEPHPRQDHAYFAIARELISNSVRHARASKVHISLRRDGSGIAMVVSDDGIGIAEEKRLDALKNGHLGLVSARERAAAVGCELRVERPAEGGTCVSIRPRD
ncbi:MAG: ATP-binding protein [Solirubrobacterales bacterium]